MFDIQWIIKKNHLSILTGLIVCFLFFLALPNEIFAATVPNTASCTCVGTVKAAALVPNSTFDSYCKQASDYCNCSGQGTADCSVSFDAASEAECKGYETPEKAAQALGLPSTVLNFINVEATCSYSQTANATPSNSGNSSAQSNSFALQQTGCEQSGDCKISDIVQMGVNFAQFIMGLSGAMFLLVFIYGGARYVLSFGKQDWVTKGRDAMVKATIGIVIVMSAWTIVSYVTESLGYNASSGSTSATQPTATTASQTCGQTTETQGWSCLDVNKEGKGLSCVKNLCPGAANIQCCPSQPQTGTQTQTGQKSVSVGSCGADTLVPVDWADDYFKDYECITMNNNNSGAVCAGLNPNPCPQGQECCEK